jgi:hypothetical protein
MQEDQLNVIGYFSCGKHGDDPTLPVPMKINALLLIRQTKKFVNYHIPFRTVRRSFERVGPLEMRLLLP